MRLFHFSEDPAITLFEPRQVRVAAERRAGWEWLNGPLVWAIDEPHSILYFFPRECPRIVVWPTDRSTEDDRLAWMGTTAARAIAYVEKDWLTRLRGAAIYRYTLPPESFEDIVDVGMWVSRAPVLPTAVETLTGLDRHLEEANVELRPLDDLTPLRTVWNSTLHASGIRLRNARNWGAPGWPHSPPS